MASGKSNKKLRPSVQQLTRKELNPANDHNSVPGTRSTPDKPGDDYSPTLIGPRRNPDWEDPLGQSQATDPQKLPYNKLFFKTLSYGIICYIAIEK